MFYFIILFLSAFSITTQAFSYHKPHYGVIETRRLLDEELDKPEENDGFMKYYSHDGWDADSSVPSNDFHKDLKPAEEIRNIVDGLQTEQKFEETAGHDITTKHQKGGSKYKEKCKNCKKSGLTEPRKTIEIKKSDGNFFYKIGKQQMGQKKLHNAMRAFSDSEIEKPGKGFAVSPTSSVEGDVPVIKLNSTGEVVKEVVEVSAVDPTVQEVDKRQHIEELEDGLYLKLGRSMTRFGKVPSSLDQRNVQYTEEKPSFEGMLKVVEETLRSYLNSF